MHIKRPLAIASISILMFAANVTAQQGLTKQYREWQTLLLQITRELDSTLVDIRHTEPQVKSLRESLICRG